MGPVGESPNKEGAIRRPQDANNEGFGRCFCKRMGIQENYSRNRGGGEAMGEKVNNQNTGSNEKNTAGGV
jgi:hypothetical protein